MAATAPGRRTGSSRSAWPAPRCERSTAAWSSTGPATRSTGRLPQRPGPPPRRRWRACSDRSPSVERRHDPNPLVRWGNRPVASSFGASERSDGGFVAKPAGSLYRGREGMWSWVAHRVTGVLVFFFLFAHVLDTALVRVSPDSYDSVIDTYKSPLVNLMEVGLVGAVLYHALNGLRVMLIDFWEKGTRYQRQMTWAVLTVVAVVMVPGTYFMLKHTIETLFGSTS